MNSCTSLNMKIKHDCNTKLVLMLLFSNLDLCEQKFYFEKIGGGENSPIVLFQKVFLVY